MIRISRSSSSPSPHGRRSVLPFWPPREGPVGREAPVTSVARGGRGGGEEEEEMQSLPPSPQPCPTPQVSVGALCRTGRVSRRGGARTNGPLALGCGGGGQGCKPPPAAQAARGQVPPASHVAMGGQGCAGASSPHGESARAASSRTHRRGGGPGEEGAGAWPLLPEGPAGRGGEAQLSLPSLTGARDRARRPAVGGLAQGPKSLGQEINGSPAVRSSRASHALPSPQQAVRSPGRASRTLLVGSEWSGARPPARRRPGERDDRIGPIPPPVAEAELCLSPKRPPLRTAPGEGQGEGAERTPSPAAVTRSAPLLQNGQQGHGGEGSGAQIQAQVMKDGSGSGALGVAAPLRGRGESLDRNGRAGETWPALAAQQRYSSLASTAHGAAVLVETEPGPRPQESGGTQGVAPSVKGGAQGDLGQGEEDVDSLARASEGTPPTQSLPAETGGGCLAAGKASQAGGRGRRRKSRSPSLAEGSQKAQNSDKGLGGASGEAGVPTAGHSGGAGAGRRQKESPKPTATSVHSVGVGGAAIETGRLPPAPAGAKRTTSPSNSPPGDVCRGPGRTSGAAVKGQKGKAEKRMKGCGVISSPSSSSSPLSPPGGCRDPAGLPPATPGGAGKRGKGGNPGSRDKDAPSRCSPSASPPPQVVRNRAHPCPSPAQDPRFRREGDRAPGSGGGSGGGRKPNPNPASPEPGRSPRSAGEGGARAVSGPAGGGTTGGRKPGSPSGSGGKGQQQPRGAQAGVGRLEGPRGDGGKAKGRRRSPGGPGAERATPSPSSSLTLSSLESSGSPAQSTGSPAGASRRETGKQIPPASLSKGTGCTEEAEATPAPISLSPRQAQDTPLLPTQPTDRRLSWVSEQRGRFVQGISACALAEDLSRILREAEEPVLMGQLRALLTRVWARTHDISVVVFLAGGGWALASPCPNKISLWRLVRPGPRAPPNTEQPGPLIPCQGTVSLDRREVLGALLVKAGQLVSAEGTGAQQKEERTWEPSLSSFCLRWRRVLETHGVARYLSSFTPALAWVGPGGQQDLLSPRARVSPGVKERCSRAREALRRTCGLPLEDTKASRAKVRAHSSLKDLTLLARVQDLSRYIVVRQKSYPEQDKVFEGLAKHVAAKGVSPDLLRVLDEEWTRAKGRKEKGCRLRIGAFLPNANIFVQYTHCKNSSESCSWAPLAFGATKKGSPILKGTAVDPWEFGELVCGVPLPHIAPRVLVFILHRGGKKVINGNIYDLVGLRKDTAREAEAATLGHCIPLYAVLGDGVPERGSFGRSGVGPEVEADDREAEEEKDVGSDSCVSTSTPPLLPVVSMGVLNGWTATREAKGGVGGEEEERDAAEHEPLPPAPAPETREPPEVVSVPLSSTEGVQGDRGLSRREDEAAQGSDAPHEQASLPPEDIPTCSPSLQMGDGPAPVPTNTRSPTRGRSEGPGPVVDFKVADGWVTVTLGFDQALVAGDGAGHKGALVVHRGGPSDGSAPTAMTEVPECPALSLFSTPTAGGGARASSAGTRRGGCRECGGGGASGGLVQPSRVAEGCDLHVIPSATSLPDQVAKGSSLAGKGRGSVWRSSTLDLRTGRKTDVVREVSVSSQAPWYDQEWYHIYDTKPWYVAEGPVPRVVSNHLREKFVTSLGRMRAEVMQRAWLNFPRFLQHPTQRELQLVYGGCRQKGMDNLRLAVDQFYRGSWGRAFKTLMGIREGEMLIPVADVLRLFPRRVDWVPEAGAGELVGLTPAEELKITAAEVGTVVSSLPRGKACGLSGCSYETVRAVVALRSGKSSLAAMYSHMLLHPESVHAQLYTSRCVGIPKKDGSARPLCMQEAIVKPLHRIVAMRIERCVAGKMCTAQKCLGAREGQGEAHGLVMEALESLGPEAAVIFFDFTNAFGTVSRGSIIRRLAELGVPAVLTRYVGVMLSRQQLIFSSPEGHREVLGIQTGVPQGEPLSMLLFAVGIDSLLADFQARDGVEVAAYADDVAMVVRAAKDTPYLIQAFMDEAATRGLQVNLAKTKVAFRSPLGTETIAALAQKGVSLVDLRTEVAQYVGLPVGMNPAAVEQHIAGRVDEFIKDSRQLWGSGVPLQMKYHLQEVCLNSRLVFIFRNTPLPKREHSLWMGEKQRELDELWETHLGVVPKPFRRLPVRHYGMGLFHIKDRRTLARRAREKTEEQKEDPSVVYFSRKVEGWVRKRRMAPLDIGDIPPQANLSLSSPPVENSTRLEDTAFRLMLAMRYCSRKLDVGTHAGRRYRCPLHDKRWTLRHIMACPLSAPQAVRKQHDRLVGYVCGIMMRSHRVQYAHPEKKTVEQEERHKAGLASKRADIVLLLDGEFHTRSLDVSVTTSWSETPGAYATIHAYKRKEREYKGEANVRVLLFDTSGGLDQAGWSFLRGLGACTEDLRRMQTIVFRGNAERYQAVVTQTKNRLYREDQIAIRARRLPPPAPALPHSEGCESAPPSPQEGVSHPLLAQACTGTGGEIREVRQSNSAPTQGSLERGQSCVGGSERQMERG